MQNVQTDMGIFDILKDPKALSPILNVGGAAATSVGQNFLQFIAMLDKAI